MYCSACGFQAVEGCAFYPSTALRYPLFLQSSSQPPNAATFSNKDAKPQLAISVFSIASLVPLCLSVLYAITTIAPFIDVSPAASTMASYLLLLILVFAVGFGKGAVGNREF